MKIIAVYPGRFQPMAKHHAETFRWLQGKYGIDNTFIVTSGKVDPPRSPFSFEEKQKIINAHGFDNVVQVRSPYRPVELLQDYDEEDTAVIFLLGEKDAERLSRGKYFQKLEGEPAEPFKDRGYVLVAPHVSIPTSDGLELSGTAARGILSKGDKEEFENIMGFWNEDIYEMIKNKLKPKNQVSETIYKLVAKVLDEMSAMGAGAVGGFSGPLRKEEEEEEVQEEYTWSPGTNGRVPGVRSKLTYTGPDIVADNYKDDEEEKQEESLKMPLSREEFILREYVRRYLRKVQKEQISLAKSEILEENRLKKYIREVILEQEIPNKYTTTGGNLAEALFLEIAKPGGALENKYKSLQTNEEQRRAFADFMLEFVQADFDLAEEFRTNIEDAEEEAGVEVPLEEEDINISVGDEEEKKAFPDIEDIEKELAGGDEVEEEPAEGEEEDVPSDLSPDQETGYVAAKEMYDGFLKNQIEKFWSQLKNDDDRNIYKTAVIENLNSYFEKWESEVTEPANDAEEMNINMGDKLEI